jgi:hypothetical protein
MSDPQRPDFLDVYAIWRNEGLTPLSTIKGYVDLLLIGGLGPLQLTEQQRQALDIIRQSCSQAIQCWYSLSDYLDIHYNSRSAELLALAPLLEEVTERVRTVIGSLAIALPDQLPLIRGHRYHLIVAFCNLLYPIDRRLDIGTVPPSIHIDVPTSERIAVRVLSGLKVSVDDARFWHPGTCVGMAATIIQQHGSQLQAESHGERIEYHFTLPVVSDGEARLQTP